MSSPASDDGLPVIRRRVLVQGRVQGVGFRATCAHRARKLGLHGFVRNRADGSVEAVFEGDEETVQAMVRWCGHGPELAMVRALDVFEEPPRGEPPFAVG